MIKDVIILNMFEELLSLWQPHRGLVGPPTSRIELWSRGAEECGYQKPGGQLFPMNPLITGTATKITWDNRLCQLCAGMPWQHGLRDRTVG